MAARFLALSLFLAGLAALSVPAAATSIPAIYAKGSPFEIGYEIGTTFKARFEKFLQDYDLLPKMLIPYYESTDGRKVVDAFEATQSATYPQYMEELRGMANATGLEFYKIFLLNIREELFLLMQNTSTEKLTTPSCSDVLVRTPTGSVIGHNEDNGSEIIDGAFFQHITPTGSSQLAAYTAYTYPLLLAGNAFAINEHGLTISVNALFPQEIAVGALARQFLTRDVLNARDINDAIRILTRVGPCASGFSINIGSTITGEMVNIEMSPGRLVSVLHVNYSYHFNQYLRLNVSHFPDPSSDHRLARIKQLPTPQSAADVRMILGDTGDKEYPIWRNGAAPDYDAYTLATAIFDLSAATMSVYVLENPFLSEPLFTMPIPRPTARVAVAPVPAPDATNRVRTVVRPAVRTE